MRKKKIKDNAFKKTAHFRGTGAEYARSMIAPQDDKMYDWLNERIRVGRFGTKQMTQLIEYALDNPTPEFFAYVMRKFMKHFGVDGWDFDFKFDPDCYESYLEANAESAKEMLKVAKDPTAVRILDDRITDWDKCDDNHKKYCRFGEWLLPVENWSPEAEHVNVRRRNEVNQIGRGS